MEQQRRLGTIYPAEADVFAALHLTPFQRVSVVILGQDPYHRPGLANGLAFSVPRNLPSNKFPASLRNIRVALTNDGFTPANHGDLMPWARQGVLLLNTALTVSEGAPNSHKKEWRAFTNTVISRLSARDEPVVFVLWGNEAIKTCDRIDKQRHRVVTAPHPSARGSYQRAFRTSGTFAKINQRLTELGRTPIDWEAC
ncbi:uracil-DNA glycosylase [Knoellia remsis]|uniref:Uracil-DNA glycosylase n=1 Tax=Knoellia remsis TaxID=407159 RepID=A0A2T0UCN2_9MICO|nr:uracil-DNA glycosylase [Knoellia remsis]